MNFRLAGLVCVVVAAFASMSLAQAVSSSPTPTVKLLKLGGESLIDADNASLHELKVDLLGEGRNLADYELTALIRAQTTRRWRVVGRAQPEAGGIFRILGLEFPEPGDFDLAVAVLAKGQEFSDASLNGDGWRERAAAISARVVVSVGSAHVAERAQESVAGIPSVRLISIGAVSVRDSEKNVVPATGDVIFEVTGMPPNPQVYLVKKIPYSDRCTVIGPARITARDRYLLPGVTFDAAGDPQQLHFELRGLMSDRAMRSGDISCEALRNLDATESLPVEIIVEQPRQQTDPPRVAYIAITKVGRQTLIPDEELKAPLAVRSGVQVEVAQFERVAEGAQMYLLTRHQGSSAFLAQGPALKRGSSTNVRTGDVSVTFVLLDLRFPAVVDAGSLNSEYEVMAVLSTSPIPNAPVDPTFLTKRSVLAVSRVIRLRVDGLPTATASALTITRVDDSAVEAGEIVSVGASGSVKVRSTQALPEGTSVYVVRHKVGSLTYSLFGTFRHGQDYLVPDLSFINPHPVEGADYQLFAIQTWGTLPVGEVTYDDLRSAALGTSPVVPVRYSEGPLAAFGQRFRAMESEVTGNGRIVMLLLAVLALVIAAATLAMRRSGSREEGVSGSRQSLFPNGVVLPALGLALLALVVYVIRHYYLLVYTGVIASVLNQPPEESLGLAVWLIVVTALVGILFDLSHAYHQAYAERQDEKNVRLFRLMTRLCGFVAITLWLFQGALYFEMLSLNSFGVTPLLGGIAFSLIAVAETAVFFFITKLVLPPLRVAA